MTKATFTGLLGSLVLTFLAGPSLAAEPKTSTPHVVIVGVSEFADKQINPRPNAENDAKALYDLFTNKDYLGIDAEHIKLLLGKEDAGRKSTPATKKNILDAVNWLEVDAKPDDLVIFAYIGEGASLGERGDRRCYFGNDSTLKDRDKDAVAAASINDAFNKLKSTRVVVLLDVNFKGFTTKESVPEASLGTIPYKEFLGDDGTEDHEPVPGRAVFSSTIDGLTPSLDLAKQGVFTKVLIDGLEGAADKEGKEADGVVVVDELAEYLSTKMPQLCREDGKTKEQKQQSPRILFGRTNHFVITKNPAVTVKVKEQLDKLEKLLEDKKITAKEAEAGRELLSRMPKLQAQRDLRKAFQGLVGGTLEPEKFEKTYESILESTKLSADDAKEFADSVMKAVRAIRARYVKETNSGDLVNWALRGLYKRLEEKLPEEINDKLGKVKDLKDKDLTAILSEAREKLGKREDLDNHKDVDLALQRMLSHLDPYTTYTDKESKGVDKDLEGMFTGIGIQIRKDSVSDMLQVVTPIRGSPAHKKGLQAGDIVTTIVREEDSQGKPLEPREEISTKGLPTNDAVKKILGEAGTKVKLIVEREGEAKPLEFEVTRGRVDVETVLGHRRKDNGDWTYYLDEANKIAYVRLTGFGRKTADNLTEVLKGLKKEGIKGFVLDLRFNPGGLLTSAIDVSDTFIDDGLIVTVRPRVGTEEPYYGRSDGSYLGFPMVCLINGYSASASEIVSACLQDHGRAIIVGERSYGKGSVQNITPFEGGDLKVTIATYWRPNNKNINKSSTKGTDDEDWGVRPNKGFLVEMNGKEREDLLEYQRNTEIIQRPDKYSAGIKKLDEFKDPQMEKALEYLREKIKTAGEVPGKKNG